MLSRFVSPAQIKQNLMDIKSGKIDVIIGTHRVLSNDVKPPHLGLLVVDEEQRFGVNHKEKIKSMKTDVDVLSLSATPIPRTLHMSLSGIRDISVLEEAPFNRRAVQTYVLGYDDQIIIQACMREIARGGQIFYLYNRTSDIDKVADLLARSMPGVRVTYAHGQMDVIGYELYCRLLDEEVRLLKSGKDEVLDTDLITGHSDSSTDGFSVEVDYDAYIPASYIQDEAARMSCYRRIGDISGYDSYSDFIDEVTDRYGDAPSEVYILSGISLIRSTAGALGFTKASIKNTGVRLYLNQNLQIDMQAFGALMRDKFYGARVNINATGSMPYMLFKPSSVKQDKTVSEIVALLKILSDNRSVADNTGEDKV